MICGIGTDIVDILRFAPWVDYPQERLLKIFSPQELADCSNHPLVSTQHDPTTPTCHPGHQSEIQTTVLPFETQNERLDTGPRRYDTVAYSSLIPEKLAARFAAKEAFFKAMSATLERKGLTQKEFSLSFICRAASVTRTPWGSPQLAIDWQSIHEKIGNSLPTLSTHLSLSHDGSIAVAFVVIEE